MTAQHVAPPAPECGLEAALRQMSERMERVRHAAADRRGHDVALRSAASSAVFATEPRLRLVE